MNVKRLVLLQDLSKNYNFLYKNIIINIYIYLYIFINIYSNAHLKVILENCELKGLDSIYKLSYLSLCAGGDFIKTSTGKGKWGAKLDEFGVMCLALRDFLEKRKDKADIRGIKAAGGI